MNRGTSWRHVLGVPLLYLVLAVGLTWPLAAHLWDGVPSPGDSLADTWSIAWMIHAVTTDIRNVWNGNVFYPYPNTVAFSNPYIPQAIIAAPFYLLTGNIVLGLNVNVLASFTIAGVGAYLLAKHYTRHELGSLAASIVFAFSSFRFSHGHQTDAGATHWLPLVILALDRLIERPGPGRALLLGLLMAVTALSNWYYGYMLLPVLAVYGLLRLWFVRPDRRGLIRLGGSLGLAAVCTLALVGPVALPYAWAQNELSFKRSVENVASWSGNVTDYLLPHWDNLLYRPLVWLHESIFGKRDGEHLLFTGLLATGLALLGGLGRLPGRKPLPGGWAYRAPILGVGLTAFVLSLGPQWRVPWAAGVIPGGAIPLPYLLLMQVVPGFDAIRVTSRYGVFVNLALAMLAAYGVLALAAWLAKRGWGGREQPAGSAAGALGAPGPQPSARSTRLALSLVLLALLTLEVVTPVFRMTTVPPTADRAPEVYRWLNTVEPEAVIVELPMVDPGSVYERYVPIYMHYSTFHWRRIVNGLLTFYPPGFFDIVGEMGRFPSDQGVSLLQNLGVSYVVVHTDRLQPAELQRWAGATWQWPGLERVAAFEGDVVYRVASAVAGRQTQGPSGLVLRARRADDLLAPERYVSGVPAAAIVEVENTGRSYYAGAPAERLRVEVCWTRPDGSFERAQLDALAPLVIPPGGQRDAGARVLSRVPADSCADLSARLGGEPLSPPVPIYTILAGDGWWDLESSGDVPARWMKQAGAFQVFSPQPVGQLRFRGAAFAHERDVEVLVNGERVRTLRIATRLTPYVVDLPLRTGENTVALRAIEPAESPRSRGLSADPRDLTIYVQRLTVSGPSGP